MLQCLSGYQTVEAVRIDVVTRRTPYRSASTMQMRDRICSVRTYSR